MKIPAGLWMLAVLAVSFVPTCYGAGYNYHGHRQPRRGHGSRMRRRYDGVYSSSNTAAAVSVRRKLKQGEPFCPMGYVTLGDHCYHFSDSPATWNQALAQCRQVGGTLAVLDTQDEIWLLRRYLGHSSVAFLRRWIGPIYNWIQGKWIWGPTGEDITVDDFSIDERMDRVQPRSWTCGAMDPLVSYQWEPVSCLESLHFICETTPEIRKNDQPPSNIEAYQSQGLGEKQRGRYSRRYSVV